jgi:hypothetical protein
MAFIWANSPEGAAYWLMRHKTLESYAPSIESSEPTKDEPHPETLLDRFAMAAVSGYMASLPPGSIVRSERIAADGYGIAAAMMEERKKHLP